MTNQVHINQRFPKIKILGIGSPFGNDQIGWKVVDTLRSHPALFTFLDKKLSLENLDRPGMDLIRAMQDYPLVILIDAVKSDKKPGSVHYYEDEAIYHNETRLISTHGFNVAQALQLAKILDQLPEKIIFYGIEIDEIGFEEVSKNITKSLALVCGRIVSKVLELLTSK